MILRDGKNDAVLDGDIVRIQLLHGRHTIVDASDWPPVRDLRWVATRFAETTKKELWYALAAVPGEDRNILMHRAILGVDEQVVHLDNDGLNNRRSNLATGVSTGVRRTKSGTWRGRQVTSKYLGVSASRHRNGGFSWRCDCNGTYVASFPGTPDGEIAAAERYDEVAREIQGTHASVNFPLPGEPGAF